GQIPVVISLHATKAFATGEGGAVAADDIELVQRVGRALNFGIQDVRDCLMPSTNGKMSEYHAAVGLAELDEWPQKLAALTRVADRYAGLMAAAGMADRLFAAPDIAPNYVLFRCKDAAESKRICGALRRKGIDSRQWYGRGIHHETYYRELPRGNLAETDRLAPNLLGLPVAPDLSDALVAKIVAVLRATAGTNSGSS
ncbi:MAG: DegT/DnrJ/EryC1/StrS family aminotransferase, partial [Alphaproteobacteria bacterium]|nr:DegT/DnrJ/EryC1/StrS family aminotransferase [Alphaproteobacteria bacterium]